MMNSTFPDENWKLVGACRVEATGIFFPQNVKGVEIAKHICFGCPVRETCLEYALVNDISHGVWGGASERERFRIKKRRRSPQQAS
jgi:WhiB family redox-sensing transcriptional regulator